MEPIMEHTELEEEEGDDQRSDDAKGDHFHGEVFLGAQRGGCGSLTLAFQLFGC